MFDALEFPEKYKTEEAENNEQFKNLKLTDLAKNAKPSSQYMCLKYYKDFKKAAGDTAKSILISTIEVSGEARPKRKAIEYTACVGCAKCLAKGVVIREELRVHLFGDVIRFEIIDEKFMERAIEVWNRREKQ